MSSPTNEQVSEQTPRLYNLSKKDGRVRWISDLRRLNKCTNRKEYFLPIIQGVLRKRGRCDLSPNLDISIQYYTFELDAKSKELWTSITPFGRYRYNRLSMGLKFSLDIA